MRNKKRLTLQEVELTGGGVQAHEVEAAGGPAAASLSRRLAGGQTQQHAALPSSVQAQDQNLPLPTLLFLLRAEDENHDAQRCSEKETRGKHHIINSTQKMICFTLKRMQNNASGL